MSLRCGRRRGCASGPRLSLWQRDFGKEQVWGLRIRWSLETACSPPRFTLIVPASECRLISDLCSGQPFVRTPHLRVSS